MPLRPFRSDEEIGPLSPLAVSVAAGFSGTVAAAASHGFDTAKSRSQCVVLPKACYFLQAKFVFLLELLVYLQLENFYHVRDISFIMNMYISLPMLA